jgi:hypothetical protein
LLFLFSSVLISSFLFPFLGLTATADLGYIVHTLLIPKQHGTSDTCTMEEEEGVLAFAEEHGLLTLGWVRFPYRASIF